MPPPVSEDTDPTLDDVTGAADADDTTDVTAHRPAADDTTDATADADDADDTADADADDTTDGTTADTTDDTAAAAAATAAAAMGEGMSTPSSGVPAATTPPLTSLDPPTLDLGAPQPEQGAGEGAPSDEASPGGADQGTGVDKTPSGDETPSGDDVPGPPPMPFTPPGSWGNNRRTWIVVALGVGLLVVIGGGALAVGLLAGSDPDDTPLAATDAPTVPDPAPDAEPPGTDAAMDELWQACAQGDMQACDDLFVQAESGSDYEEFGRTCGDRGVDALLCVDAFAGGGAAEGGSSGLPDAGPEASPPGTDAAMEELWAACADEDWRACDDLFFESDIGSAYEEFGRTCGYRIDDAFLCTEDMAEPEAGDEGLGGGDIPGAGPDPVPTVAPATDEELDALWTACQDEDWQACDRLYFESAANSDYEFFGATCGARDLLDGAGQLCQVLHAEPGDTATVVLPTELARGMCFDEPDEPTVVFWLQTVPCEDTHDVEIMGVATFPRGPIPEDMSAAAVDLCLPIFDEFVGVAYTDSRLDIYHLSPTPESWELGDHEVACGVYDPDGPVEGSLKGSER